MKQGDMILVRDFSTDDWVEREYVRTETTCSYPIGCVSAASSNIIYWRYYKEMNEMNELKDGDKVRVWNGSDTFKDEAVYATMYNGRYACHGEPDHLVLWDHAEKVEDLWFDVDGNSFPDVNPSDRIQVKFGDGSTDSGRATSYFWGTDTNIVAYRKLK